MSFDSMCHQIFGGSGKCKHFPLITLGQNDQGSLIKAQIGIFFSRIPRKNTADNTAAFDRVLPETSGNMHQGRPQACPNVQLLLSHTAGTSISGFRGYRYGEGVPTLLQLLDGVSPANSGPIVVDGTPGDGFRYSGGGYEIMEQAIFDVTGVRWPELMQERILEPMDMRSSTYTHPLPDALAPRAASGYYASGRAVPGGHHIYPEAAAAALWTTPSDVARFLIEVQNALRDGGSGTLTRASAETLLTEVDRAYGLGFNLLSLPGYAYFGHRGANDGFRGGMIAHTTSGDGLVLLTNSDRGSDLWPDALEVIAEREGWPGF